MHQMNQTASQQQSQPNQQMQQNLQTQPMSNSNQMPPVSGNLNDSMSSTQNCIRSGCTNMAIVSNDWEDEYCSSECVITHCRSVFGNWVHNQSSAQQNFPAVI
jgi:hypothetical protein